MDRRGCSILSKQFGPRCPQWTVFFIHIAEPGFNSLNIIVVEINKSDNVDRGLSRLFRCECHRLRSGNQGRTNVPNQDVLRTEQKRCIRFKNGSMHHKWPRGIIADNEIFSASLCIVVTKMKNGHLRKFLVIEVVLPTEAGHYASFASCAPKVRNAADETTSAPLDFQAARRPSNRVAQLMLQPPPI